VETVIIVVEEGAHDTERGSHIQTIYVGIGHEEGTLSLLGLDLGHTLERNIVFAVIFWMFNGKDYSTVAFNSPDANNKSPTEILKIVIGPDSDRLKFVFA